MDDQPTRVLIIEADADESSIIGSYLAEAADRSEKFALTMAPRISTGLHFLGRREFDIVLLDLVLPLSVGLEGFRKIHDMKPSLPIIVLTGLQDVPLAVQAVKLGAYDFFIKGSPDCCLIKRAIRYALERRRMADALDALLAADDAPKLVVDADGIVRSANAAARAFDGAPRGWIGAPFGHPLPDGDAEISIPDPKAPERTISLRSRSVSWNGAPARLITLRDAAPSDHLKRLQAEIKEGLRIVEVKNHFMSQISHELRNTLSALTTAAYCLKDGVAGTLSPRQERLVDMISRNAERQSKIVENVLDLARFQSGKLKIEFRAVDVGKVIAQIVEESRLEGAAAEIRVDAGEALPAVEGDPDLIAQVVRNLLDNARRYAKRRILVKASDAGAGGVLIEIVDDGTGIPPERLGDLFTEFVQLDRADGAGGARADGSRGTGLGLTICKEIVEGHHGRIWADNAPGRGARFRFILPLRAAPEHVLVKDERERVTSRSQLIDPAAMAPGNALSL